MNTVTGRIIAILEPVSGESKKNPGQTWKRQDFVLETEDSMYPRKVCFNLWGEDRIAAANIQQGDLVTVEFEIESREYNGRWYTSINGRNVIKGTGAASSYSAPQTSTEAAFGPSLTSDPKDDLPF